MAQFLSRAPSSPLVSPLGNDTAIRSSCSAASISSNETIQHNRVRNMSINSLSSIGSYFASPYFRGHAQQESSGTPPQSVSSMNITFSKIRNQYDHWSTSSVSSRRASLASACNTRPRSESITPFDYRDPQLVGVAESQHEQSEDCVPSSPDSEPQAEYVTEEEETVLQRELAARLGDVAEVFSLTAVISPEPPTFQRWVNKLKGKRYQPPPCVYPRKDRWTLDDFDSKALSPPLKAFRTPTHRKSNSQNSSIRFITSVRSATATLASTSIATVSRRTSQWRRGHQRSSLNSNADPRPSIDSVRSTSDEAARLRSRKRREKVEELIRTEESYIADLKALSTAYFTILGYQAASTSFVRSSAQCIIAEILQIHDRILGQLHRAVPFAEYDQTTAHAQCPQTYRTHNRWHSIDTVPTRATPVRTVLATIRQGRRSLNISRSDEDDPAPLRCDPQIVAAVAHIFVKHLGQFNVYEEYGANFDLIQKDIDETQRTTISWLDYDKAIEALSEHINPVRSREANHKKARTLKDLLIKPIQRIPRYELLFNDLAKLTPVCDGPDSHAEIRELCTQLNMTCQRINKAKENTTKTRMIETTWLIGDRLVFSSQVPKTIFLQLLGRVVLCGCLHMAYRGRDCIKGGYVICVLFESTLLLASADDESPTYYVMAGVTLAHATVDEADNQKGLQCVTAPHSWKLIFEHAAKMYELILSACSAVEAEVWRTRTSNGIESQARAIVDGKTNAFELYSPLTTEMRSIGKAFGKPSSFVRRMSVHRTATVGPTADLNHVIIKNTQAVKEAQENPSQTSLQIPRSQSVQMPSHVQTLAPRRAERLRLEGILADVWSREVLPFPGMARRSDPIRASANHVIRKFSMASITSNFSSSKRNASYTSIQSWRKDDRPTSKTSKSSEHDSCVSVPPKHKIPPPVSFHTAPDAFLPADFQLHAPTRLKKKSALRTLTMTMERPFSPLLGNNENKPSSVRRAQSVRDGLQEHVPLSRAPLPIEENARQRDIPVYNVALERAKTPARSAETDEALVGLSGNSFFTKTPKKSKSRLLKLFQ